MKKNIWVYLITIVLLCVLMINIDKLTDGIAKLLKDEPTVVIIKPNKYYKEADYDFVKRSETFVPYSKQDLYDIFYSILNNGYTSFTFYCPSEYTECTNDVNAISQDRNTLTHINNFVSPFNNFSNIRVIYSTSGEVNVVITKLYSDDEINTINTKMDKIMSSVITSDLKLEDKVIVLHDYIINNSVYDEDRASGKTVYNSNIALGPLVEGHSVCGGYADAMALFLNRLGIPNFKVASDTHVWNAVFINDEWLHLDLTWDDPVNPTTGANTLLHKFYLITTEKLESYKIDDHNFDKTIYQELAL